MVSKTGHMKTTSKHNKPVSVVSIILADLLYISVPICQNTFSPLLVKNELRVFSESVGPPPSSTQTLVAIAGL